MKLGMRMTPAVSTLTLQNFNANSTSTIPLHKAANKKARFQKTQVSFGSPEEPKNDNTLDIIQSSKGY